MNVKNIKNRVLLKFPQLRDYVVIDAFVLYNELYLTTEFEVDIKLFNKIEEFAINLK